MAPIGKAGVLAHGLLVAGIGWAVAVVQAQPAVGLEVRFSRPLAVFHYVRQLTPKARANPYKAQFEASRLATSANRARLEAFGAIRTDYEYGYPDYPEGKIEGSTSYILKRNLILASSLADFRTRSIGVIPSGEIGTLVSTLAAFTPVYDALIYEPVRATFERQLAEIEALLESRQAAAHFERVRTFYRASWDPSIPFIFAFYPRPAGGGFSATAYGNVSESELPSDMRNYPMMLALMLHEAAHILLDEQQLEAARETQQWYAESRAPIDLLDRRFPYRNVQRYLSDFSDTSLRELRATRTTKLIVISRNHAATLNRVREAFPELADWQPDPAADGTHAVRLADKTLLIVVTLVTGSLEARLGDRLPPLP